MTDPTESAARARFQPLLLAALMLLSAAVLILHLQLTVVRPGASLLTFDSAEYALAGRELAESGRLATPFVHPAALAVPRDPPFPLLAGHPLVPVANALLFRLLGARAAITLVPAGIAYLVLVLATAWLALRLSGESGVALAAAAAVMLSTWTLRFASEGLSEVPFAALSTLGLAILAGFPVRPRAVALGVVLGLAHLTRPVLVPMLPAWILGILVLAPPGRGVRTLAFVLLGFAPAALLLLAYKAAAFGSPFADVGGTLLLASLTPDFAVARLNRMMPPPAVLPWLAAHPLLVLQKFLRALPSLAWQVTARLGRPFLALLAVRVLAPSERPGRGIYLTVVAAAGLLAVLAALTVPDPRMLFPLLPAATALALDEAWRLLRGRGVRRGAAILACGVLALAVTLPGLVREWRGVPADVAAARSAFLEREWNGIARPLAAELPPGAVVASDAAPWIAWYAHRPVTLIPLQPGDLATLARRVPLGALVLTNEWLIQRPGEEPWRAIFAGRATLPDWVETARIRSGRLEAVVLRPGGAH